MTKIETKTEIFRTMSTREQIGLSIISFIISCILLNVLLNIDF